MLLHQFLHLKRKGSGQALSIVFVRRKTPAVQMLINEGVARVPMLGAAPICRRQGLANIGVKFAACRMGRPESCAYIKIPIKRLIGIKVQLAPNRVGSQSGLSGNLICGKRAAAFSEVGPTLFDLCKLRGVETLRLNWIAGPQAKPFFAFADELTEIVRHTSPEPVIAAVWMLPRTRH